MKHYLSRYNKTICSSNYISFSSNQLLNIYSMRYWNSINYSNRYIYRCQKCQLFYNAQDACESLTLRYVIALREAIIKASTFRASELDTASFHAIIILMRELPIDLKNRKFRETGLFTLINVKSYYWNWYEYS